MADTPRSADPLTPPDIAAYSGSPTHGWHLHGERPECREWVVGDCVLDATRAPRPLTEEERARWMRDEPPYPGHDDALRAALAMTVEALYGRESVSDAIEAARAALATPAAPPTEEMEDARAFRAAALADEDPYTQSLRAKIAAKAAAPPTEDDPELAAHAAGWSPDRHGGSEL